MKSNSKTKVSCVIPAYNEEKNIARVLKVVTAYKKFDEIIIIDDGSHDKTTKIVKQFQRSCKRLKLIINSHNLGKTGAVKKAVYMSAYDLVVILDADLINLTHTNLNDLIKPVETRKAGMTILDRAGDKVTIMGVFNLAKLYGGERCFWKDDFEKMQLPKNGGYLLEVIMNMYYIRKGIKIQTVYCNNLYTVHQYTKMKFWTGIRNYIKMIRKIWNAATVADFARQIILVRDARYPRLYKIYDKRGTKTKPIVGAVIFITNFLDGMYLFTKLNLQRGFHKLF